MDRRKFLSMLAAGAVVTAEGLWIPGRKSIFLPPRGGWSSSDEIVKNLLGIAPPTQEQWLVGDIINSKRGKEIAVYIGSGHFINAYDSGEYSAGTRPILSKSDVDFLLANTP